MYTLPQVLVFQEFQAAPASVAHPMRAHISGPLAHVVRFSEDPEQGRLGVYDHLASAEYAFPGKPAGSRLDREYTRVFVRDGLLRYFDDTAASGATITKVAGYSNRIAADTINFATNGQYAHSPQLADRGVRVGDVVRARFTPVGSDPVTLWTHVRELVGSRVASDVDNATADDNNAATNAGSSTATQTAGPVNLVEAVADHSGYDGLASGDVTETYTLLVTESSQGGDPTTARIRVLSASGRDDQDGVVPADYGDPTAIGTRGLTVTFDTSGSDSGSAGADDLVAGQTWTVTVAQAYTAPVFAANSGDVYTGPSDTTYVVEVVRGGTFAGDIKPTVAVTTTTGIDMGGPLVVPASGASIPAGSYGVTVSFTGTGLRKGDRFYVDAIAASTGPVRTIVLGHNIPSSVADNDECSLELYLRRSTLDLPRRRSHDLPAENWTISEDGSTITLQPGITVLDGEWTDSGIPTALPLVGSAVRGYGVAHVEYRAWYSQFGSQVNTIESVGSLSQIPGPLHPDNPLKWALSRALQNANGVTVAYSVVADPDNADNWASVVEHLRGRYDVYGLVPLTRDRTIQSLFAAHVNEMSRPEQGLWRVAWFGLSGVPQAPVVSAGSSVPGYSEPTTTDGQPALAVIEADTEAPGNPYTIVRVPGGNAAFESNGVRTGDVVRAQYTGDGYGGTVYQTYTVAQVLGEDELRLNRGPATGISMPSKIEVWRHLTADEEAEQIAAQAGSWGDRRIRAVWPDVADTQTVPQEGYFVAAALAGLASGVLPHQGLTNVSLSGFSDVSRTTQKFNRTQLDVMAGAGVWIVTQNPNTGEVYTRHAVTTGNTDDVNEREEMIVRNIDNVSYRFKDHFAPFIGRSNVTPRLIQQLGVQVPALRDTLIFESSTDRLGGQIIDATILQLEPHPVLRDRVLLALQIEYPAPFNVFEQHLIL